MRMIGKAGRGVVVLIRRHRIAPVSEVLAQSTKTMPDMEQSRLKEYGVGAQILLDLGVENMILLTNTQGRRVVALEGYGLRITETRRVVPGTVT
jgi:3,4-dihydroxy 2-butanone 4-phosphate synthase/GTP cyclohydrolase II